MVGFITTLPSSLAWHPLRLESTEQICEVEHAPTSRLCANAKNQTGPAVRGNSSLHPRWAESLSLILLRTLRKSDRFFVNIA